MYGIPRTSFVDSRSFILTLNDELNCKMAGDIIDTDEVMLLRDVLDGKINCFSRKVYAYHDEWCLIFGVLVLLREHYFYVEMEDGETRRYLKSDGKELWIDANILSDQNFWSGLNDSDIFALTNSFEVEMVKYGSRKLQVLNKIVEIACGEMR